MVTDLADYYDHDERELNRMIYSSGLERMYMADPHDGGDNIDERRDREKTEARVAAVRMVMAREEVTTGD